MDWDQDPTDRKDKGCVGGNEVEILALEIGPELGPEVSSAMTIAKNNGRSQ